ncbi:hypothetical protein [Streptomyces sp. NPDC087859]|uniref:hypothetical protein n=1 Tax=Streptomyces sp. NPDC087859 TaxID=3365812 RepID=UPI00381E73BA
MALMRIPPTLVARTRELPEVAVPSRVAPEDARQLSRLPCQQLMILLHEGRLIHH